MMSKRFFFSIAAITLLFSLMLFLFPQIDLSISSLFYDPKHGFLLNRICPPLYLSMFRDFLIYVTYGTVMLLIFMLAWGILCKKSRIATRLLTPKTCLFILICFAVAPGLFINVTLKDHWGRARPYQVQQFGGDKIFTPAWVMSTQCEKNCSFTSGETANVFCYFAFLFILPRKKLIAGIILAVGALTVFERIGQGAHFFSDALLSGFLDFLLIWLIYQPFSLKYYVSTGEEYVKNY
jgi:lipid A 4'-phosphatase